MNESLGEYRLKIHKKFGRYPPDNSDHCVVCGRTYGEHCGYECPEKEDTNEGNQNPTPTT